MRKVGRKLGMHVDIFHIRVLAKRALRNLFAHLRLGSLPSILLRGKLPLLDNDYTAVGAAPAGSYLPSLFRGGTEGESLYAAAAWSCSMPSPRHEPRTRARRSIDLPFRFPFLQERDTGRGRQKRRR